MKRPGNATLALGHPLIGGPLILAGFYGCYVGWATNNPLIILLALVGLAKLATAGDQASAYRSWRRAWDALDENTPRRRAPTRRIIIGVTFGLALTVAILGGYGDQLLYYASYSPIGLTGLALVVGCRKAIRWLRGRNRRVETNQPVAIVAKPALPIPSIEDAYRALPSYCHALLGKR